MDNTGKRVESKTPWMRVHASDWRSDTLGMSFELQGFYMQVLALMWDRQERLPNDPTLIAQWMQVDRRKVARLLGELWAAGKVIEVDGSLKAR